MKKIGFWFTGLLAVVACLALQHAPLHDPRIGAGAGNNSHKSPTKQIGISRTSGASPGKTSASTDASAPTGYKASTQIAALDNTKPTQPMVVINNKQYPLRTYAPLMVPNDPSASQWWVSNTHLDQSWSLPAGNHQTTLAIVDTGFALQHEEFAGRWYVSPGESGPAVSEAPSALNCTDRGLPISASCNLIDDNHDGIVDNETGAATYENPSRLNCTGQHRSLDKSCNRMDDDGNGYIDDTSGWDFMNNDNAPLAGELNPSGTGTTHGTEVAGIAAATGNNGKGIAGVDWNTKILPIQALDDNSYGDTLSVGRAIYYAASQGVDVISISLGSSQPDEYVREAVQAALARGIVVVAAAGNDGCDCIVYPGNYPEVLAVGALNGNNVPASFSSYGQNLDILAPGTNLTAPTWQSGNRTSAYASGLNGTSFATPMIGGMLTRLKSAQPSATPIQLLAALGESVNRLGLSTTIPRDDHYGFGTLDANAAVSRMLTPKAGQVPYAFTPASKGNVFDSASPAEPVSSGLVYPCDQNQTAATPVFDDIKGDLEFFTVSKAENQHAIAAGYSSNMLMYACIGQPHDTTTVMHSINMFPEFKNRYLKLGQ